MVANIGKKTIDLKLKCQNEAHLWRMGGPLIGYHVVDINLPHRVIAWFGLY
jgi:hypothetical protein